MPLHDLDPSFCSSLKDGERSKFAKFVERRKKKAAGIGEFRQVTRELDGKVRILLMLQCFALGRDFTF